MIDTSIFGPRLKEERKRLGLTQADAASKCGVKRETWSRYETGALMPGMEVLAGIAAAGADVQYILTGKRQEGEPEINAPTPLGYAVAEAPGLTPRQRAVLALLDKLDETEQREIQEAAEKIAEVKALRAELAELKRKAG